MESVFSLRCQLVISFSMYQLFFILNLYLKLYVKHKSSAPCLVSSILSIERPLPPPWASRPGKDWLLDHRCSCLSWLRSQSIGAAGPPLLLSDSICIDFQWFCGSHWQIRILFFYEFMCFLLHFSSCYWSQAGHVFSKSVTLVKVPFNHPKHFLSICSWQLGLTQYLSNICYVPGSLLGIGSFRRWSARRSSDLSVL